ncbi:MAG TPA: DinB family protein [Chryseosolibacter sp.]
MVQTTTKFQSVLGTLVRKNASYNVWACNKLIAWLSAKEPDALYHVVPSSFPSIRETLIHMSNTERFWLDVLRQRPLTFSSSDLEALSLQELFVFVTQLSEDLSIYIDQLSDEQLLEEVSLDTPWVKGSRPRYEFLQHVVNHTSYHRGQIITIGRNLGFTDAPMTDFNYFSMMPQ